MIAERCLVPYEEKEDCGHYGINQRDCLDRGCCWRPSNRPNDPWCFNSKDGIRYFFSNQIRSSKGMALLKIVLNGVEQMEHKKYPNDHEEVLLRKQW